jgi:hypothetical protein
MQYYYNLPIDGGSDKLETDDNKNGMKNATLHQSLQFLNLSLWSFVHCPDPLKANYLTKIYN